MSTLDMRFGLDVRHGSRSHTTSAHVFLQGIVRHANGMLSVTPVCSSLEEMEGQIDNLKGELDDVLRQAERPSFEAERPQPRPELRALLLVAVFRRSWYLTA